MSLKGKIVVITGASSGIGKGFAEQLAADGLNVVLVARRLALLEELGKALSKRFGIQYRAIEADLGQESAVKKMKEMNRTCCVRMFAFLAKYRILDAVVRDGMRAP